mmetsp:Transcript_21977/g.25405  ORF Transcript_21977/g.25405 Transcript_21977/m.25405 type:complete len:187 (+) Transcript_21977:113-673(+)
MFRLEQFHFFKHFIPCVFNGPVKIYALKLTIYYLHAHSPAHLCLTKFVVYIPTALISYPSIELYIIFISASLENGFLSSVRIAMHTFFVKRKNSDTYGLTPNNDIIQHEFNTLRANVMETRLEIGKQVEPSPHQESLSLKEDLKNGRSNLQAEMAPLKEESDALLQACARKRVSKRSSYTGRQDVK